MIVTQTEAQVGMSNSSISPIPPVTPPQRGVKMVSYEDFVDRQVELVQSQLRWGDLASASAQIAAFVLAWLLVTVLVDHWGFDLGPRGRFLALAGMFAGVASLIWLRLLPRFSQAINPAFAAWTVETSHPALKHRLLNFILLRQTPNAIREPVLRELQEDAARELSRTTVDESVDQSPLVRWFGILAVLVVFLAAYSAFSPKSSWDSFRRMLIPWSHLSRPTRVRILDVQPGNTRAFTGTKIKVRANIQHLKDDEKPRIVYWGRNGDAPRRELELAKIGADAFESEIPEGPLGIVSDLNYSILAGDAVAGPFRIQSVVVPSMNIASVHYDYPLYTGLPPRDVAGVGDIEAIEGTRITVYGRANSAIASASLEFNVKDSVPPLGVLGGTLTAPSAPKSNQSIAMEFAGTEAHGAFRLLRLPSGDGAEFANYSLRFKSLAGELNPNPPIYRIEVTPDLAPLVEILEPQKQESDVAVNQNVRVELRALDPDYQLSDILLVGVHEGREILRKSLLSEPGPGPITANTSLSPRELLLQPGDTLLVWAEARDNRADPASASLAPNISKTIQYSLWIVEPGDGNASDPDATEEGASETADPPSEEGSDESADSADPQDTSDETSSKNGSTEEKSGEKSGEKSTEKSGEQSGEQPAEKSEDPPGEKSGEKSGEQTVEKSGEQSSETSESGDSGEGEGSKSKGSSPDESSDETPSNTDDSMNSGDASAKDTSKSSSKNGDDPSDGKSGKKGSKNSGKKTDQRMGEQPADSSPKSEESGENSGDSSRESGSAEGENAKQRDSKPRPGKTSQANQDGSPSGRESKDDGNEGLEKDGEGSQPNSKNPSTARNAKERNTSETSESNGADTSESEENNLKPESANAEKSTSSSSKESSTDPDTKKNPRGDNSSSTSQENEDASGSEPRGGNGEEISLEKQDGPVSTDGSQDGDAFERLLKKLQEQGKVPKDIGKSPPSKDSAKLPPDTTKDPSEGAGANPQDPSDPAPGAPGSEKQDVSSEPSGTEGSPEGEEENGQASENGAPSQNEPPPSAENTETGENGTGPNGKGKSPNGNSPDRTPKGEAPGDGNPSGDSQGSGSEGPPRETNGEGSESSQEQSEPSAEKMDGAPRDATGEPNGTPSPTASNRSQPPMDTGEDIATADPWNKAYAEEAADMVLDHLKEHPRDVDPELLNDMGWTQDELDAFVKRWESLREQARQGGTRGDQAREELDAALQGLGLSPPKSTLRTTKGLIEKRNSATERGTMSEPPAAYADQYRAFLQSRQRSAGKSKP